MGLISRVSSRTYRNMSLTTEAILKYSKCQNLDKITRLKCWGRKISDISIFNTTLLTNLQTLNLSSNNISDPTPIANLPNLTELYLRQNKITNFDNFSNFKNCKLQSLWIDQENFIPEFENFSTFLKKIKNNFPNLKRLNGKLIEIEDLKCLNKMTSENSLSTCKTQHSTNESTLSKSKNLTVTSSSSKSTLDKSIGKSSLPYDKSSENVNILSPTNASKLNLPKSPIVTTGTSSSVLMASLHLVKLMDMKDLECLKHTIDEQLLTLNQSISTISSSKML